MTQHRSAQQRDASSRSRSMARASAGLRRQPALHARDRQRVPAARGALSDPVLEGPRHRRVLLRRHAGLRSRARISFSRSGGDLRVLPAARPAARALLRARARGRRSTSITRASASRTGQPLFTEHGQPSRYLQRIIWAFQDLKPGIEVTRLFIARLLELKLIEPIDLEAEFDDGTEHQLRWALHHQPGHPGEPARCGGGGALPARLPAPHPLHDRLAEAVSGAGARKNSRLLEATSNVAGLRT